MHATTYYSPSPFAIPLVYKTSSSSAVKGEGESQMLGVGCSLSGGRRRGRLSSNFSSRDRRLDFADLDSGGVSLGARTHPHLDGHGRREVCRRGLLLLLVQYKRKRTASSSVKAMPPTTPPMIAMSSPPLLMAFSVLSTSGNVGAGGDGDSDAGGGGNGGGGGGGEGGGGGGE